MSNKKSPLVWLESNWIFLFIIAQPLLDVLAYWTRSEAGTAAGYIRLVFMVLLPLHLLFTEKKKKPIILSFGIIMLMALLHIANLFRVGYADPVGDIKNMAKIFYLPVMAVCFCTYMKNEAVKKQVVRGIFANTLILAAVIVVSYVTGTYNPTYGYGLGTSAWVTDANRCTHSIILSALSIFAVYFSLESKKTLVRLLVPAAVLLACLTNGTSSCYLTALACLAGYPCFMIFRALVCKEKMPKADKLIALWLLVLAVVAVAVYPVTPRAKITAIERAAADKRQSTLEDQLIALGYDIRNMSPEEKMADPVVREIMAKFYTESIYGGAPGLIETYDVYRIMEAYDMSTDARRIADTRRMKRVFAQLTWEDSDTLTKIFGFEYAKMDWPGETLDLENDWHAIFYYYGAAGFAVYAAYMLSFIWRVLRKLRRDFKGSLTFFNFALILAFFILIGLAHFSGALLKRPNSSIYMAFILALLSWQCKEQNTQRGIKA